MLGDLARYAFWVHLREIVDPDDPEVVRALATIGARFRGSRGALGLALMREELRRTFPALGENETALERAVLTADEIRVQCHLEELFLGRLDATKVVRMVRVDGLAHLEAARARGRGAVLVFPHAGAVQLLVARLGFAGLPVVHVTRGAPPAEPRRERDAWPDRRIRQAREAAEDRLPVRVHGADAPSRALPEALQRNDVVAVAFDGRGGTSFRPATWLGRPALLSTLPWRLAVDAQAPVVPAVVIREPDRAHRLILGAPIRGTDCADVQAGALAAIEPVLRRNPEGYGPWMAHCRRFADADDHPLFVDTATDDRWRRYAGAGWGP